jgi:hypothetical protein
MNSGPADKFVFLVDVNLPRKFRFFNKPNFIHVADINPSMTDKMIWDYLTKQKLSQRTLRARSGFLPFAFCLFKLPFQGVTMITTTTTLSTLLRVLPAAEVSCPFRA